MLRAIALLAVQQVVVHAAHDVASGVAPHHCDISGKWADNSERGFKIKQKGWALDIFEMQFNSTVDGGVTKDCTSIWANFSGTGNVTGTIGPSRTNMTWSDNTPWFKRAPQALVMNLTTYVDGSCSTALGNYAFAPNACYTTDVGVSFMGQCTQVGDPGAQAWTWLVSAYPKPNCDGSGGGVSWYGGNSGQCGPMGYLGGMAATCARVRGG